MNTFKIEYVATNGAVTSFEETTSMPLNKWKYLVGMSKVRPSNGMEGGELKTYVNGELALNNH